MHEGRARAGESAQRENGPQAEAHSLPAARGDPAARPGQGIVDRDPPQLERERGDDFKACGVTAEDGASSGLRSDIARARYVAQKLYDAFYNSEAGISGETVATARERNRPRNVEVGSRDHLLFIALTSSVNRQRKAYDLWDQVQ